MPKKDQPMPEEVAGLLKRLSDTGIINLGAISQQGMLETAMTDFAPDGAETRWYVGGGSGYVIVCASDK